MFAGNWTLIRLILRRDRVKLPVWIISIVVTLLVMIPLLSDVYGDKSTLTTLYQTFTSNPAGLFLTGSMDEPTFGALMTIETVLWWGLAVAFMNTLFIIRHTRQNEEMGAQELILSGQVHHGTGLIAALVVAFLINLTMAIGMGVGMGVLENSWGIEGAWLYAFAMGAFGFTWAVIATLVAQLVESARSANGILAGLIGITFVLRGIGDFMGKPNADGLLQPTWASWLSPFGWMQATRSLTFPEWWPLVIPLVFAILTIPVAFWLLSKRDVGAGILLARKGRVRATAWLKTPLGLTWYLQKNIFLGWFIGVLVMAITIGVLVPEMSHVYGSSDNMKNMIEAMGGTGAMVPSFLSAMLSIIVLMVMAYIVQGIGELRSEESSGHLENLLATRLSRFKWLGLHAAVVLIGGIIMLAISGAALAVCVTIASDFSINVWEYTIAGLSYFPALLVFIGGYVALFSILPRATGLIIWTYYGFVAFMSWLGPLLKLNHQVMDMSIMTHIAAAPAQEVILKPFFVLSSIALLLLIFGLTVFRRRNLISS